MSLNPLKAEYRKLESMKCLQKLQSDPTKIPTPSRDEMMAMLHEAQKKVNESVNTDVSFKHNFLTNAFDGSEDHLVSRNLFTLVGEEMVEYRTNLLSSPVPKDLKDLLKSITPPEGVGMKELPPESSEPADEGMELLDGNLTSESEDELESAVEPCQEQSSDQTSTPAPTVPSSLSGDLAILDDFSSLCTSKFAGASPLMRPFFVKMNCLLKSEYRKIRSREAPRINMQQNLVQTETIAPEHALSSRLAENWDGFVISVLWPEGTDDWANKFWTADISGDTGTEVLVNYTGDWANEDSTRCGTSVEAKCSFVVKKRDLAYDWTVKVIS